MPILTLDTELHSTVCKLTIYATMLSIHLTYLVFHFYKFFCCRRKRALYLQWHFVCAKLLYIASNCIASQCDTHTISLYVGCASIIGMLLTTSQCSLCRLIQYVSVEYLVYLSLCSKSAQWFRQSGELLPYSSQWQRYFFSFFSALSLLLFFISLSCMQNATQ